jgi:hypothetical protein
MLSAYFAASIRFPIAIQVLRLPSNSGSLTFAAIRRASSCNQRVYHSLSADRYCWEAALWSCAFQATAMNYFQF